MFEDEADEVGSDVEAYCPKCKVDTTHVVISKYEDEIRRVQCNPCGDVHSFRKPRGEAEDDIPEPVAARKRAMLKKPNFEEFFAKHSEKHAKPYEFREHYKENIIVTHPKFGTGFVSEVVSDSKVEITFKDGRRILVHNRKDIPGIPLAAEGDGTPTPPAHAKDGHGKDGKDGKDAKDGKAAKNSKAAPAAPAAKAAPKAPDKAVKPASAPAEKPAAKADAKAAKPAEKADKPDKKADKKADAKAADKSRSTRSVASAARAAKTARPAAKPPAKKAARKK